jgi:hypothetical protein
MPTTRRGNGALCEHCRDGDLTWTDSHRGGSPVRGEQTTFEFTAAGAGEAADQEGVGPLTDRHLQRLPYVPAELTASPVTSPAWSDPTSC